MEFPTNYVDHGLGGIVTSLPTGPNAVDYQSNQIASVSHNMMPDIDGKPLFFIVDGNVYDKDGYFIDVIDNGSYTITGTQELCIVPDPSNCMKYYIFSAVMTGPFYIDVPTYSILDMSANNIQPGYGSRKGAFVYSGGVNAFDMESLIPFPVQDWDRTWMGYAASKLRSDNSRFVFMCDGSQIFRFRINSSGVLAYDGYTITTLPISNSLDQHSELELVEVGGGYKIACVGRSGVGAPGTHWIYVADLNTAGTVVAGSEHAFYFSQPSGQPQANVHGLEFSEFGNYLYFSHETNTSHPNPIQYIDLSTYAIGSLIVSNQADFKFAHIERAIDGSMYFVTSNRLAKLTNPDVPSALNWTSSAVPFSPAYGFNYQTWAGILFNSYSLPDQIDGMDYSSHLLSTETCCLNSSGYDKIVYTAGDAYPTGWTSTTQTWTPTNNPLNNGTGADAYIRDKLTIPAGYTITIKDMNLYFAPIVQTPGSLDPGGFLEVLQGVSTAGGRLILQGCTLSVDTRCKQNVMWMGAQVYGDATLPQTPYPSTKQGKIELQNSTTRSCLVEHALRGIMASKATMNPASLAFSYNFANDGGIIRAKDATFRNNVYDIEMRKYTFGTVSNQSWFTNCTFITDAALKIPTLYPLHHVYLNDLQNINFSGCDFSNTYATDASNPFLIGKGITGLDAKFTVQDYCPSLLCPPGMWDHSSFNNLWYGIYANNSLTLRTVTCTNANFNNNRAGILLSGVNFAIIVRNNFNIYKAAAPNSTASVYGLYLNVCNGYKVQENTFQDVNHASITAIGNSVGVIVNNSGPYENEIYKNTFHNLYIGGQSQGTNACTGSTVVGDPCFPGFGQRGLRWRCNTFNDIITFADLTVTSGQIAYDQGYCVSSSLSPAGNLFNHTGTPPVWNIFANSSVQEFRYTYHDGSLPNYFNPVNFTGPPSYPTLPVHTTVCTGTTCTSFGSTCCPSKLTGYHIASTIIDIIALRSEINSKKSLIDGGNTSDLLSYVNSNASNGQKKNMLLSKSPYLSDEVLIAYLNHNPPPGHIQQVLLANSGISDAVWEVVETMGLPNGIKNSINTARSTTSQRSMLYENIAGLNATKDYNLYEVIGYYLRDTISVDPMDSILTVLDEEEEKLFLITKVDANIEKGELIEAANIKTQISSTFGEDNGTKVMELNIDLYNSPSKCYGITHNPALFDKAYNIAYDESDHCNQVYPRSIFMLLDSSYTEVIEGVMMEYFMPINNNNNSIDVVSSTINIYPNPVVEELFIESIANSNGSPWSFVNVTVTDMQGRVLITKYNQQGWTFLNLGLTDIQSGNYILKLTDEFGNFEVKTFIKIQ